MRAKAFRIMLLNISTLRRARAGAHLVFARCLALFRSVTLVDSAGEAIDKPSAFVGWAFKPDISGSDRHYQRGQQNARTDDCGANDRRHERRRGTRWIAASLIFALSLLILEHAMISSQFLFLLTAGFLQISLPFL
jgi:hypothetical protein